MNKQQRKFDAYRSIGTRQQKIQPEGHSLEFNEQKLSNELNLLNKRLTNKSALRLQFYASPSTPDTTNSKKTVRDCASFAEGSLPLETLNKLPRAKSKPKTSFERFLNPPRARQNEEKENLEENEEIEVNLSNCKVLAVEEIKKQLKALCSEREIDRKNKEKEPEGFEIDHAVLKKIKEMGEELEQSRDENKRIMDCWAKDKVMDPC